MTKPWISARAPVSEHYHILFNFTGKLEKLTINITEEQLPDEQLKKYREGRAKATLAE